MGLESSVRVLKALGALGVGVARSIRTGGQSTERRASQARSRSPFLVRARGTETVTETESAPLTRTSSGVSQWLQRIRTDAVPARETPSV